MRLWKITGEERYEKEAERNFKFFAGPVYVTARDKCVMWGGQSDEWAPENYPRGDLHSAFRSGWTHCG